MISLFPILDNKSKEPYYHQLYKYIRDEITSGKIPTGERLPSLRSLAKTTGLSITTIDQAYSQLDVEGYVESRPQSGYYVNNINYTNTKSSTLNEEIISTISTDDTFIENNLSVETSEYFHDPECFDFTKWKKCMNKIINEYSEVLFFGSDPQGESILRAEIAKYLYMSRGVYCKPEQIIIGAGTQQITNHIATLLRKISIEHLSMEDPGYKPVRNTFRDRGFAITDVPVGDKGIEVDKLPTNIKTVTYVSPSNQVFTGAVMPIGRRYELLNWAINNDSYIIEDDYDSELRYFGRPIPALKSLDDFDRVIYLGSFSSTLFAAMKISYMVLPMHMTELFESVAKDYSQTCSKLEQLSLAMFMETGNYQTHLKKLRKLYANKLNKVTEFFQKEAADFIDVRNSASGINLLIRINTDKDSQTIKKEAATRGIPLVPLQTKNLYLLYYNQIPLDQIPKALGELLHDWQS